MFEVLEGRLAQLVNGNQHELLRHGLTGLEKESLRVGPTGAIAQTPHPRSLGSALTNPYITTDYSEALLELITPPCERLDDALGFLRDAHKFVYDRLGDEVLWATSMPCVVEGETRIPIAFYGTSNLGMMKTVYRRGLGYRYGRVMQVIAGVHFNYSVPEAFWPVYRELRGSREDSRSFIAAEYFGMIRNLQRYGWIIPYLFGASPAVCKSFFGDRGSSLPEFDENTYYEPFATSLRMGDIGYTNTKEGESGIKARYDDLSSYIESLTCAIETSCPEYSKIGVLVDGEWRQLNANILQIENEYYTTVRPKQVPEGNEKPTLALRRRGVRYVELRSLDVNAYEPLGVSDDQLRFVEALMLFCLLDQSPPIAGAEREAIDSNQSAAAHRGRDPALRLIDRGRERTLREWAASICEAMVGICELLDGADPRKPYSSSLARQREVVRDPERTPSARMLSEMREHREPFFALARRMSYEHQRYFSRLTPNPDREAYFARLAEDSLEEQETIETADEVGFDEFLAAYFAQR